MVPHLPITTDGPNRLSRFGSIAINSTPDLGQATRWATSVQLQQIGEHLIDVSFPLRDVRNGQDGVDPVVPARVNGLHEEAVYLEDAKDVSVLDDALGQTNSVIPHVRRFLVEWQSVE